MRGLSIASQPRNLRIAQVVVYNPVELVELAIYAQAPIFATILIDYLYLYNPKILYAVIYQLLAVVEHVP